MENWKNEKKITICVRSICTDPEIQKDLAQEMRLWLWENRGNSKDTESCLFRCALSHARDKILRAGRSVDSFKHKSGAVEFSEDRSEFSENPEAIQNLKIDIERIEKKIRKNYKDIFRLLLSGLELAEIAEKLNLTPENAWQRKSRMISELKRIYAI